MRGHNYDNLVADRDDTHESFLVLEGNCGSLTPVGNRRSDADG